MSFHKPLLAALLLGSAAISPLALATNGYFAHGYGIKSLGMAGVGFALPQDALAAASNPVWRPYLAPYGELPPLIAAAPG